MLSVRHYTGTKVVPGCPRHGAAFHEMVFVVECQTELSGRNSMTAEWGSEPDDPGIINYVKTLLTNGQIDTGRLREFLDAEIAIEQVRPLRYTPREGQLLSCDFSIGFRAPEICKRRPVIVVSCHGYKYDQCIVVIISSTRPLASRPYTLYLPRGSVRGVKDQDHWVNCDVIHHVSRRRLDRLKIDGTYQDSVVSPEILEKVRGCVLHAIGLGT
jgi:mRNA interferase MazF